MVVVEFNNRDYQFDDGVKVRRVIKDLKINPETVLLIYNDQLITEDEILKGGTLRIRSVISSG